MYHIRKRGSIAKVTYFPEWCSNIRTTSIEEFDALDLYIIGMYIISICSINFQIILDVKICYITVLYSGCIYIISKERCQQTAALWRINNLLENIINLNFDISSEYTATFICKAPSFLKQSFNTQETPISKTLKAIVKLTEKKVWFILNRLSLPHLKQNVPHFLYYIYAANLYIVVYLYGM
jgi:hypothetical protein